MSTHATGTIEITGWNEETYAEIERGRKLTKADVTQQFHGDIEGKASVTWLMAYRSDGTADYLGLLQLVGTVGGAEGSIVMRTEGTFDGRAATGPFTVVPGTGTGALEGMTGSGTGSAPKGGTPEYDIDYDLG